MWPADKDVDIIECSPEKETWSDGIVDLPESNDREISVVGSSFSTEPLGTLVVDSSTAGFSDSNPMSMAISTSESVGLNFNPPHHIVTAVK